MSSLERYSEEIRESWQEQEAKINSLGSIKEIVNSKQLLLQIITYSGDRHLINQFYDMLNEAIETGEVLPEDLTHLRSGWLGDCIINLETVLESVERSPYHFEKGDKLNYTTQVNDVETQIATFTNRKVIAAFAGVEPNSELSYCEQSLGQLSLEAQLKIIEEIMKAGNINKGITMLNELTNKLASSRRYAEEDRKFSNQGRS